MKPGSSATTFLKFKPRVSWAINDGLTCVLSSLDDFETATGNLDLDRIELNQLQSASFEDPGFNEDTQRSYTVQKPGGLVQTVQLEQPPVA